MDALAFVFALGMLSLSAQDPSIAASLDSPASVEEPAAEQHRPPVDLRSQRIYLTNKLFRELRTARLEQRATPGPVLLAQAE